MRIAVGLSGGVDSAVSALLLKRLGHECVGVSMKLWPEERQVVAVKRNACYGPDEAHDLAMAEAVCRTLGIQFHLIDCASTYERMVLDYFRSEYRTGRTPNPCVRCNQLVKLGVLPMALREAGVAFDAFATGHYARIVLIGLNALLWSALQSLLRGNSERRAMMRA